MNFKVQERNPLPKESNVYHILKYFVLETHIYMVSWLMLGISINSSSTNPPHGSLTLLETLLNPERKQLKVGGS